MATGISVSIASDTREYARGVQNGMVEPMTQAQAELDRLGQHGEKAGAELESAFRSQQGATTALKGDIEALNVKIRDTGGTTAGHMSAGFKKASHDSAEGFTELKDSAKQNMIQTAASFTGGFDQISGGVQGMVAEFLAGFGPGGMIAGMALAGGIGLLTAAIDGAGQATQQDAQMTAQLADEYVAAGSKGKRSFDDIHTALTNMMTDTDGSTAVISLQKAWDASRLAGADYHAVVQSIAEADPAAILKAKAAVDKLQASHTASQHAADAESRTSGQGYAKEAGAAGTLSAALGHAAAQAKAAQRAQELAAAAGISQFQRKADLISQLHQAYTGAAGSVTDFENKESGVFNTARYIHAMQQRQKALDDYKDTLLKAKITPEAQSYIESLGADDAAAMMAGYKKASPKQRQQLDQIWTAAGRSNAQSYGEALGDDLKHKTVTGPKVAKPTADGTRYAQQMAMAAQRYMDTHTLVGPPVVVGKTKYGKPIYG